MKETKKASKMVSTAIVSIALGMLFATMRAAHAQPINDVPAPQPTPTPKPAVEVNYIDIETVERESAAGPVVEVSLVRDGQEERFITANLSYLKKDKVTDYGKLQMDDVQVLESVHFQDGAVAIELHVNGIPVKIASQSGATIMEVSDVFKFVDRASFLNSNNIKEPDTVSHFFMDSNNFAGLAILEDGQGVKFMGAKTSVNVIN